MFQRTDRPGRARWRRSSAAVLSALTVGGLVAAGVPASATAVVATARIAGADRYDTAAKIAATKFPTGVQNVVLVTGQNFPDGLAGAYLAGIQGAAILLTTQASVPSVTTSALSSLKVKNVTILGGTDAVSAAVATSLSGTASTHPSGGNLVVTRIGGTNRYDTARLVNTSVPAAGIGIVGGKRTAIVATGENFADALAASAAAYAHRLPIVLTESNTLSSEASATLTALSIGHVLIMGGFTAVSAGVESSINALGIPTFERFIGTDRMDTAAKFAAFAVANIPGFTNVEVTLARGDLFVDALAGSTYAGDPKPILLTQDPNTLGGPTSAYLTTNNAVIAIITAFGGPLAISDAVLTAAQAAATTGGGGGGGGGGGAGGSTIPPTPTTAGPNLRTTAIVTNGFALGNPSTVRFTFDKGLMAAPAPAGVSLMGTATAAGTSSGPPTACVLSPDALSADCQFPSTVNVANFTIGEVNGGAVLSATGLVPNVLGTTPLGGSAATPFPGPLLVRGSFSAAGNTRTFVFNQNVMLSPLTGPELAALFGLPAGSTPSPPVANEVTFTLPATSSASTTTFLVRAGAVAGTTSGILNPDTGVPGSTGSGPNLVGITRTTAPNQFIFTVDKAAVIENATRFAVYLNSTGAEVLSTTAAPLSPVTFLATFPPATINNNTTDDVALGALKIAQAAPLPAAGAALGNAGIPVGTDNSLGSKLIAGATTALANGPILQSASGNLGSGQVTYTFDKNIAAGTVVAANFYVVAGTGVATPGGTLVGVTGNQVVIAGFGGALSTVVGAGVISPLGSQPGVNGGAPGVAAMDSAGNNNVPGTVAATAT